jgi:propionate CoA-transferase
MLAMAMAARNSGGIVIAEVRQLAAKGTLPMRAVKVPGALVDYAYVDPEQRQTYATRYSPYYAGAMRRPAPAPGGDALALDVRKVLARRSLLEFRPGDICNLGFGVSQGIGAVAFEEGIADQLVLTVEQGSSGRARRRQRRRRQLQLPGDARPAVDVRFYDGGGLDVTSLSFAESTRTERQRPRLRGRVRPRGSPTSARERRRSASSGMLTSRRSS